MITFLKNLFKREPTPEDTFKALQSCSFDEMRAILTKEFRKQNSIAFIGFYMVCGDDERSQKEKWVINRNKVIARNGWTVQQFSDEYLRRLRAGEISDTELKL